ncbi:alpha/beta fold hydrolase [Rossellomorea sp. BNER]|uniref:alpha/beta fold hydrolase n=1 Tax=Rossellomorea sp. BNER TaxID=2962031 RepID=UPI003AF258EC|nr:alpha/beta hydrolase [Rossellomorea sp. BNER]
MKEVDKMGYCTFQHRQLFFEDMGEGTPIIMIHPPGMGRKTFIYQTPLAEKFRLILPDLSGHGDSTNEHSFVSMATYVEEIKTIVDHLQLNSCVLLGYSAGGIIAQEFAYKYPEFIQAIILAGGYPRVKTMKLRLMHLLGMKMVRERPQLLINTLAKTHAHNEEEKLIFQEHMEKANRQIWYHFYKQSLYYNREKDLKNLKVPVLLIYGGKSQWINKHLPLFKELPQYETKIIEESSHQLPTKYSNSFNEIVYYYVKKIYNREI